MREKDKQMIIDHYLDFYRMAFALLHDESDTEDAVQEAIAATFSHAILAHPYQYCTKALYNQCYKALRRRKRLQTGVEIAPTPESEQSDMLEYRLTQLQHFKANLPPRMAEVLDLYFDQGLTKEQIAKSKGVSESMIKKLYYNGLEKLRKQFVELEKVNQNE